MADNRKWFKLWNTLLIDSISIQNDHVGMFCILGCLVSSRGENGILTINEKTLTTFLKCDVVPMDFISHFNVQITPVCNGNITVTFKNWNKYQLDSTGYERQKRFRERQSVTGKVTGKVTGQEEEEEEDKDKKKNKKKKRKEEENIILPDYITTELFEAFSDMRIKIKKPMTAKAEALLIKKLEKMKTEGHDIIAVMEQSILNSWQDVYPLKINKIQNAQGQDRYPGINAWLQKKIAEREAKKNGRE